MIFDIVAFFSLLFPVHHQDLSITPARAAADIGAYQLDVAQDRWRHSGNLKLMRLGYGQPLAISEWHGETWRLAIRITPCIMAPNPRKPLR